MIVWTCPDCGYINLRVVRTCRGCRKRKLPPPARGNSLISDAITLLLCLVLLAVAAFGLYRFVLHLYEVATDLLP